MQKLTDHMTSKNGLYIKAYYKVLEDYAKAYEENPVIDTKPFIKKLIVYGVKATNTATKNYKYSCRKEAEDNFQFVEIVKDLMATLTPKEFMNLFPIEKDYDGHKYQCKDFFFTSDYVNSLNKEEPIREEIDNFLWDYMNVEIHIFLATLFGIASDLRRFNGHPSMMEEFLNDNGIKHYTMHTDSKGKQFLFDGETGKTVQVKPKRHLHIV